MYLKVATVEYAPFMVYHKNNSSWTGTCYEILKQLEQDLDLTFDIFEVESGAWGKKGENGSWDGMIGAVVRGEADIAGNDYRFFLTVYLAGALTFSQEFRSE